MKTSHGIVFTGGGSGGHVMKNLILMRELRRRHPEVQLTYLGSRTGYEAALVPAGLATMRAVPSGKLRRYFSLWTAVDAIKFFFGFWVGLYYLLRIRPILVFSSGGYVALPVCLAAWALRIPIVTHETDSVPGWTTRIVARLATKVCLGYESALPHFVIPIGYRKREGSVLLEPDQSHVALESPPLTRGGLGWGLSTDKFIITGNPVRPELYHGDRGKALATLGFRADIKTLLVVGGSQGAQRINDLVVDILSDLTKNLQVIHVTGKGKSVAFRHDRYRQFEYVKEEYADFLTLADVVVSRAGGNSLAELVALQKPTVMIPLSTAAGDHQMKNAREMASASDLLVVLDETVADRGQLLEAIRGRLTIAGERPPVKDEAVEKILAVLVEILNGG